MVTDIQMMKIVMTTTLLFIQVQLKIVMGLIIIQDGERDEGVTVTSYLDTDGDGFGNINGYFGKL